MKPTFDIGNGTYFGGKGAAGVVHHIINQIPLHDVFVSGFLGHCQVMRWKRPASINFGFDVDLAIIAKWNEAGVTAFHDFFDFLGAWRMLDDKDTFLYLDPPYLHKTRSSNTRYKHELTEAQHLELLTKAKSLPCMVAISCYDNELYQTELATWRKIQFKSQTRGGSRTETLYMNYPAPAPNALHDPRFLGHNFRAREKGKRRIATIKRKITRLAPEEKARLHAWLHNLVESQQPASLQPTEVSQE